MGGTSGEKKRGLCEGNAILLLPWVSDKKEHAGGLNAHFCPGYVVKIC